MHCFSVFFQSSLKGEVKGAGEKLRAQELPASLTGVKEVANELKIKKDRNSLCL